MFTLHSRVLEYSSEMSRLGLTISVSFSLHRRTTEEYSRAGRYTHHSSDSDPSRPQSFPSRSSNSSADP
jgi:hypothetical protein